MRDGKYGPYVNWAKVNATLPKGVAPDTVTIEQALELIAAKAGSAKKPARKAAAKKAPAKKPAKATSTKPAAKKPVAKKAPAKKTKVAAE